MEPITVQHTFPPIFDKNSRLLILGTVPSVKSRENDFYYGHPKNRFWKLMAILCGEETPVTKEEKTEMLLRHGIALYDVVEKCTIVGSSDRSIKDVVPVDLAPILEQTGNIPIFANGATAEKLYRKYLFPKTGISAVKLPSTVQQCGMVFEPLGRSLAGSHRAISGIILWAFCMERTRNFGKSYTISGKCMILLGILRLDIDIQGRTCYNTTEVNKETYQEWLRDRAL